MTNAQHVAALLFHRLNVGAAPARLCVLKPPPPDEQPNALDDLIGGWERRRGARFRPLNEEADDE